MNPKSVIILLAIAVVLMSFLIFSEHHRCGDPEEGSVLLKIDEDTVDSLCIEYEDTTMLIVGEGSMWSIQEPVTDDAAYPVIRDLLAALTHATVHRSFEPGDSWSAYGLSTALITLRYRDSMGWVTLHIGDITPSREYRYVRMGDEPLVTLVPEGTANRMLKRFDEIRARELIAMNEREIGRIQWNSRGGRMIVERFNNGWRMVDPIHCRANDIRIDAFVQACRRPLVTHFVPCVPECREIYAQGSYMVFSGVEQAKSETLWIDTDEIPVHVLKSGRPDVMVLGDPDDISLPANMNDWRDRRLIPFYSHRVNMVEISRKDSSELRFRRRESGWFSDNVKVTTDRITDLIRTIEDCSIDSFLPESVGPDTAHTLEVCMWSDGGDSVVIGFGPPKGSEFTITVSDLTPAALVACIDPDTVSTDIESWRDRRLVTIFEYDVETLAFETGTEIAQARRLDSGEWEVSETWPPYVEPSACIASLNTVRIREFMVDSSDTIPVRSEGTLRVTCTDSPPYSIDLTLRTDNVLYAAVDAWSMVALDATETDFLHMFVAAFERGD